MVDFLNLLSYFIIYSIIGFFGELCWKSVIEEKKIVKETGFLVGPWCPIYGIGALIVIFLLSDYQDDVFGLFIISMVLCTLLEYITSYVMEKIFGKRWWDYSNNKFNLNGRICLLNSVVFGLCAVILINCFHPLVVKGVSLLPNVLHIILLSFFLVLFIIDLVITLISMLHLKQIFIDINKNLKKKVVFRKNSKTFTESLFSKKSKFISLNIRHLLKRFPNLINNNQSEVKKALVSIVSPKKRKKNK